MSALLATTMVQMKATVEPLVEAGLRESVKIMIGGAPVTDAYAKQIGADAYAPDAASAVDVARGLAWSLMRVTPGVNCAARHPASCTMRCARCDVRGAGSPRPYGELL
jgi:cobalamin-dependent methionine synthase I